MAASDGRSSRAWKALCARLKWELPPICHICGESIDRTVYYLNKRAWTLDHVLPLDDYPHLAMEPGNLRPAHRGCNSSKGKRSSSPRNAPRTSRRWT